MAPDGLGHYVRLDMSPVNCTISVNGRNMVVIYAVLAHKATPLADLVIPTEAAPEFASGARPEFRIPCMGPEVQLIDTYRSLCDPDRAPGWPDLMQAERRLRRRLQESMKAKIGEATKGAHGGAQPRGNAGFWAALLATYAPGGGRVIIGQAASDPRAILQGHMRLQLVSARRPADEAGELRKLADAHDLRVETAVSEPRVPTDLQLQRLTGYFVGRDQKRQPFIDVYHLGQDELVPWVEPKGAAGVRVGAPFVVLRFYLVDLWTMMLLLHVKIVQASYAREVLHETLRNYTRTAAALDAVYDGAPERALQTLFPFLGKKGGPAGFTGRWLNPETAQKRRDWRLRKGQPFAPPYYPAARARPGPPAAADAAGPRGPPPSRHGP